MGFTVLETSETCVPLTLPDAAGQWPRQKPGSFQWPLESNSPLAPANLGNLNTPPLSTLQFTSLGSTHTTNHSLPRCRNITVNSYFHHPVSFRSSGPVQFKSWFWQCASVPNPILFVHIIFILNFFTDYFFPLFPRSVFVDWDSPHHVFLHSSCLVLGLHEVSVRIFLCWDCNVSVRYFATRTPLVASLVPTVASRLPGTFLPPGQRVPITAWGRGKKKSLLTDAVQFRQDFNPGRRMP